MSCNEERLISYLHDALPDEDRRILEAHLGRCAACRSALEEHRQRTGFVARVLEQLDPGPAEALSREAAWSGMEARMAGEAAPEGTGSGQQVGVDRAAGGKYEFRGPAVTGSTRGPRRRFVGWGWRLAPAATAAAALAVVIGYAPARELLAEFLSIFRVERFSAVAIDPERAEDLARLQAALKEQALASPVVEREPGKPLAVQSRDEASMAAGFPVSFPDLLPDGATRTEWNVIDGPAVRVEFDADRLQQEMRALGLGEVPIPPMQAAAIRIDIPSVVRIAWNISNADGGRDGRLELVQVADAEVAFPPGSDPRVLGQTYLMLLGLPREEAERLASKIDWTRTVVVPIPRNLGWFREVDVAGAQGLFLEGRASGEPGDPDHPMPGRHRVILWQRDQVVYALQGSNVIDSEMLRVAESVR